MPSSPLPPSLAVTLAHPLSRLVPLSHSHFFSLSLSPLLPLSPSLFVVAELSLLPSVFTSRLLPFTRLLVRSPFSHLDCRSSFPSSSQLPTTFILLCQIVTSLLGLIIHFSEKSIPAFHGKMNSRKNRKSESREPK